MVRKKQQVGSQTIRGAAHTYSDIDWLVLVWSKRLAIKHAKRSGFHQPSVTGLHSTISSPYTRSMGNVFESVRDCHNTNLIFTSSSKFYNRFVAANTLAINLGLIKKEDRVRLFQYVLYGNLT